MNNKLTIQELINKGRELLELKPQPIDPYCNLFDYVTNSNKSRNIVVYQENDFTKKCDEWIKIGKREVKDFDRIVTLPHITETIVEDYANAIKKGILYLQTL